MSNLKDFIGILAERFHNENDLSDVTYCLMLIDEEFKDYFLRFLFPDIKTDDTEIMREVAADDSRPDFIIETSSQNYLIEVKKWDRNQHFEQYIGTFPNYKRAYITNYNLGFEKDKFVNDYNFITWREIFNHFSGLKSDNLAIQGYLDYLGKVCCLVEVKDMRFGNLAGLYQFNRYLYELIESGADDMILEVYDGRDSKDAVSIGWSGRYFSAKKKESKTIIYPWFGVWYNSDKDETFITMDFRFWEGWCNILEDKTNEILSDCEKAGFKAGLSDDDSYPGISVFMPKESFDKIQKTENIDEQKEIIKNFFVKVLNIVKAYI